MAIKKSYKWWSFTLLVSNKATYDAIYRTLQNFCASNALRDNCASTEEVVGLGSYPTLIRYHLRRPFDEDTRQAFEVLLSVVIPDGGIIVSWAGDVVIRRTATTASVLSRKTAAPKKPAKKKKS